MSRLNIARELMAEAGAAGLSRDPQVQRWVRWAGLTGDEDLIAGAAAVVEREAMDRVVLGYPFYSPLSSDEVAGPVEIGTELYRYHRVGLRLDSHIVIIGPTGTGKTVGVMVILRNASPFVRWWVVDLKQDYRHLAKAIPDTYTLGVARGLKFNPLVPYAGVNLEEWCQSFFFDVFAQSTDLLSGTEALGLEILERLYAETRWPTMGEFADRVARVLEEPRGSGPRRQYAERLLTRLRGLLFSFRRTYDCRVGHPLDELMRHNVVFELDGIETTNMQFQARCLLFAAYQYRLDHCRRNGPAELLVVMDEGQIMASPLDEVQAAKGLPLWSLFFQRAREFGIRVVFSTQSDWVGRAVLENARTTICYGVCSGQGVEAMGKRLGLTREQQAVLPSLGVGTAVVHFAGRCPAIGVQMDHLRIQKDVTDEQAAAHAAPFLAWLNTSVVPAERKPPKSEDQTKPAELELPFQDQALLRHVAEFPALSWAERTQGLREKHGMAATAAQKHLTRLINLGLLEKVNLKKAGGRGSGFVGLVLTTKGRGYLRKEGVRVGKATRGDSRHALWIDIVVAWHEAHGWTCDTEVELAERVFADVVVRKPHGERIAIEVELGTSTAQHNISKLGGLGLDRIILACDGDALVEAVRRTVEANLPPEARQNVEFAPLQRFLGPAEPKA
jgi:hypothetical protein